MSRSSGRRRGPGRRAAPRDAARPGPRRARAPAAEPEPRRRIRPVWIAGVLLAGAVAVIVWRIAAAPAPHRWPVPDPVTPDMPAPVTRALTSARQAVLRDPDSPDAWGRLGAVCDAHELYQEARICYGRALSLAPDDFQWAYLLAVVEDFLGAEADVVAARFEAAIDLNRVFPPAHYRYGEALLRQGRLEAAREAYARAIELDDDFALAHRGLGQALLALGDNAGAAASLERASALDPEDGAAPAMLARAYRALGDMERAEEAAARARRLEAAHSVPDPIRHAVELLAVSPSACERRVAENMQRGNFRQAIVDLELSDEMLPGSATTQLRLGVCCIETLDAAAAIRHLTRAIEIDGGGQEAYVHLGAAHLMRSNVAAAAAAYRRGLTRHPDSAVLHARLAAALGMQNDLAGAIAEFERSAALAEPGAELLHNWGTALLRTGRHAEAAARFEAALKLDPDNPNTLYNLGLTLENLGRTREAIARYRRAAEIDPAHEASLRLATIGSAPER